MSKLKLSKRDLALLYYTWQNRFLARRHYQRKFWPELSQSAASKRLSQLCEAKLLRQTRLPQMEEAELFSASYLGNRKLTEIGLIPEKQLMDFPREPSEFRPTMRHDLTVVDVRIAFEESGADGSSWVSDHELRVGRVGRGRNLRTPDGVFEFEEEEKQFKGVLELELSPYREEKLAPLLRRLKTFYGDHSIFFVCTTAARVASFRSWCLKTRIWNDRPRQIRMAPLAAVRQEGLNSIFVNLCPIEEQKR